MTMRVSSSEPAAGSIAMPSSSSALTVTVAIAIAARSAASGLAATNFAARMGGISAVKKGDSIIAIGSESIGCASRPPQGP